MAIIKCKMCVGDLQISENQNYATCEYCGSTMTLPKALDERKVNLFNRVLMTASRIWGSKASEGAVYKCWLKVEIFLLSCALSEYQENNFIEFFITARI